IDAFELVGLATEQRMHTLIARVQHLPSDTMFLQGPKLKDADYSWAPRSLMGNSGGPLLTSRSDTLCTPTGLQVKKIVIRFDE
ncbi:hypothetical protein CERSUDRAFT_25442, partial [Gelatoporia subvermispora B]